MVDSLPTNWWIHHHVYNHINPIQRKVLMFILVGPSLNYGWMQLVDVMGFASLILFLGHGLGLWFKLGIMDFLGLIVAPPCNWCIKNVIYYPHLDLRFVNNSQQILNSVIKWLEIPNISYEIMNDVWSQ